MDNNILRDLETIRARVAFTPGREAQVRVEKYIADLRAELARARETIEVVAEQRNRALEAVEKLRAELTKAAESMDQFAMGWRDDSVAAQWTRSVAAAMREALSATEPKPVDLPKCDHCGAIGCGADCDGSSHYTPDTAKDGN